MKKVRRNFIFFFLILVMSFGFLFQYAYSNLELEERRVVENEAEKVYNLIQSEISLFILREESFITSNINQNLPPWGLLGYSNISNIGSESHSTYFELLPNKKFKWSKFLSNQSQIEKLMLDILKKSPLQDTNFGRQLSDSEESEIQPSKSSLMKEERDDVDEEGSLLDSIFRSSPKRDKKDYYPDPIEEKRKEKKIDKNYYQKKKSSSNFIENLILPQAHATQSRLNQKVVDIVSEFPFKVHLVGDDHLVFYRYSPLRGSEYLQGFVVELDQFFSWILDRAFVNSRLIDFSRISIKFQNKPIFDYGISSLKRSALMPIYSQKLGYPLNRLILNFESDHIPQITNRFYLNLLLVMISVIVTFGLWIIYKNVVSQVLLSEKRQDFVSSVTHELRTPLTTIQLYSDMLNKDMVGSEEKKKNYYQYLSQESSRLARLIENVLQLARLEKRTLKLNLKKDDPLSDIQQLRLELSQFIEGSGFEILGNFEEFTSVIEYDPEALKQIMMTLIENSLKFGKENKNKKIVLDLRKTQNNLILSLSDFGPGIPNSQHKKVFEKFYRVESELTRKTKGTGIGLSMVKMLVEAMGAKIQIENHEPSGVTFKIIFSMIE